MNPTSSHGQENKGHTSFSAQKAEKLATAVYMITDIIDAREPLRWKVREEAMEILSLTSAPTGDVSTRMNVLYRTTQAIERILHVLSIAQNTKLVSTMNASIVIKEYSDLKEKLSHSYGESVDDHVPKLNHQFFKVEALPPPVTQIQKSFPQTEQTIQIKRTPQSPSPSIGHVTLPKSALVLMDTVSDKRLTEPTEGKPQEHNKEENKSSRRSVIIALLRTKSEISVSDAMKQFPGVSDKTVQRELVAMVEAGILTKKGEKRWSTYSLKN